VTRGIGPSKRVEVREKEKVSPYSASPYFANMARNTRFVTTLLAKCGILPLLAENGLAKYEDTKKENCWL